MGLVIGVCASLSGLGGGFLVVPLLLYIGKEAKMAVGTSFFYIFFVSISSLIAYSRLGSVDWKTGLFLAIGGVCGAQLGPMLLQHIPQQYFKMGFSVVLVATGVWMFLQARPH